MRSVLTIPSLDSRSRGLLGIQVVMLSLYALILVFGEVLPIADNLTTTLNIISDACAALACVHAARSPGGAAYAKAWRRLAAAQLAYVVGSLGWFVPSIADQAEEGLSLMDGAYFMFYPFVFLAALAWPRRTEQNARRLSHWVDALVAPVGALMVVWFGLVDATARSVATNSGGASGALLYPFADVVLLFAVVVLTRDPVDQFARFAGVVVAFSLCVATIGDVGLALALTQGTRGDVSWPDLFYVMASLLMTISALAFRVEIQNQPAASIGSKSRIDPAPRLSFIIPAAAAGAGFLALVYDAVNHGDLRSAGMAIGASLLVTLGIIRAGLSEAHASRNAQELSIAIEQVRESQRAAEMAREGAEAALRAKGEFFAVMGHEIRTPLNAVIGMTQVLLATPLSATQRESAEVIRQGGDALLAVVNDLLDFSKMEAGRLEIESLPLNPGRTIERLVLLMEGTAKAKGLTIEVTLDDLPRLALGDDARLGQILLNLLSNAIKFSNGGVIRVAARAAAIDSGLSLTVSVSDPGIGIPQERVSSLFQPFAQLSPGRTRNYGGTGLGLVICKRLAEMMGGSIHVESEAGKGSTFTFRVVLRFADHFSTVPIPAYIPGLPRRREESVPLNVLIIEDNSVNQLVARSMVEMLGHKVNVVDSGTAAIEDVRARSYDVILTDLMMPEMDGVETARRLREIENGRKALIIALTAAATVEDRERCLAAGMDGFLAKPFTLEALRTIFARFG